MLKIRRAQAQELDPNQRRSLQKSIALKQNNLMSPVRLAARRRRRKIVWKNKTLPLSLYPMKPKKTKWSMSENHYQTLKRNILYLVQNSTEIKIQI
jgi:hypothetical protein